MKKLFTEKNIIDIIKSGSSTVVASKDCIFTPSALDKIREFNLTVKRVDEKIILNTKVISKDSLKTNRKIALGSDHTGFHLKGIVSKFLTNKGYNILDVGTFSEESCDFPDFAYEVAQKVLNKEVEFGIMIDATGIPSAITANKLAGIRAATCYNEFTAKSAREHNNANMMILGAKAIGEETVKSMIDKWLATDFGGERHQRRLDKITAIEKKMILNKFK